MRFFFETFFFFFFSLKQKKNLSLLLSHLTPRLGATAAAAAPTEAKARATKAGDECESRAKDETAAETDSHAKRRHQFAPPHFPIFAAAAETGCARQPTAPALRNRRAPGTVSDEIMAPTTPPPSWAAA